MLFLLLLLHCLNWKIDDEESKINEKYTTNKHCYLPFCPMVWLLFALLLFCLTSSVFDGSTIVNYSRCGIIIRNCFHVFNWFDGVFFSLHIFFSLGRRYVLSRPFSWFDLVFVFDLCCACVYHMAIAIVGHWTTFDRRLACKYCLWIH